MNRTWLIQRLHKPYMMKGEVAKLNPFAFGGGLKNGGLNQTAADALAQVFNFDYMGAAEFEYGAVPEALKSMYDERENFVAESVEVAYQKIRLDSFHKKILKLEKPKKGFAEIYIFAHKDHMDRAKKLIRVLVRDEHRVRLKEYTRIMEAILSKDEDRRELAGWLELDNGFFFFTDKKMFEGVLELFGYKLAA